MPSVARLLVAMVLVLLAAAPFGVASAAPAVVVGVVAEQPAPSPNPTAPSGPNLTPEQQSENAKSKLVVGIIAVVLLGIVVLGRQAHNKRRKAAQG